ncbi:MAG: hypothetical protein JXA30_00795 [Deltaproteobacteria bacterium]|nr:hypothetical protein [Deltaproteobacteria bacterium]
MIDAIRNERDEKKKAIIALELPKISNSLETKKVFEDVLDSISIGTSLQSGEDLKTTLAAESSRFYDPTMIDWLLGQARNNAGILVRTYEILCHKDSPFGTGMSCYPRQRIIDDIEIRLRKRTFGGTIAKNILRLARPSQLELAKSAVETYIVRGPGSIVFVRIGGVSSYAEGLNDPSGRKEYELVAELLKECEEQPKCYIAALLEKKNHNKDRRIVAIKSAYMAAILGDKETRDALVGILGTFEEPEVKIEIARAIDHLSRNGSKTTALLLRKILEEQSGSRGAEYAEADAIIAEVAARLDARED